MMTKAWDPVGGEDLWPHLDEKEAWMCPGWMGTRGFKVGRKVVAAGVR